MPRSSKLVTSRDRFSDGRPPLSFSIAASSSPALGKRLNKIFRALLLGELCEGASLALAGWFGAHGCQIFTYISGLNQVIGVALSPSPALLAVGLECLVCGAVETLIAAKAKENQLRKPKSVCQNSDKQTPVDTKKELAKVADKKTVPQDCV
jgi:hypothetical protein